MARQALVILVVVAAFGILVPLYKGIGFMDPRILAAYACLALLFVAPASAESAAAQGRVAPPSTVFPKIALIVAWGWGMSLLILASAMVTLNLTARGPVREGLLLPPWNFLSSLLTFSLAASIAIAALGALLARRFSAAAVKTILRTGFLVILLLLVFGSRVLPESVQLQILDQFSSRRTLTHLAWQLSAVFGALAVALLLALFMTAPQASSANIPMAENHDRGGG
jgi:hypothetical protein